MTVLLGCRDLGRAETAAAKLAKEGLTTVPILLDVTRAETIRAAAAQIEGAYGKLDVLGNYFALGFGGGSGECSRISSASATCLSL